MTVNQIKDIPLLSSIDDAILDRLLAENRLYVRQYAKGTTVHQHQDTCTALDVVLAGSLVAYSLTENGCATTLFEFGKNSIIGANLLFGDQHVYPLNIYSKSFCTLLHISYDAVLALLHDYDFVIQYVKSLSLNSQGMNRKMTIFMQKTLRENLIDYLKQQAIIQKTSDFVLPISKKELADLMGVQRPSLFRELKKLKDDMIIEIDNRGIRLLDK